MDKVSSAGAASAAAVAHSEILLAASRPELFRTNAFRITGLPVDATAGDIVRREERIRMAAKFGGGAHVPSPLPLSPLPDGDMIRAAVDRLRDPERRLVDEFFWFWPLTLGGGARDPALLALANGQAQEAMNIWMHQESHNSLSNVSMHNLAVLAHVTVLDLETQPGPPVDPNLLGQYWSAAFLRWKALMDDEAFWSRLTGRIRDLDDPRLTTGTARRMRFSLPVALLSINAQMAVRAAESGNPREAQRHLGVMQTSGLAAAAVRDALARAVEPIRDRIKTHCQTAERESEADVVRANEVGRQLLNRASPLLAILSCVLPAGDPTRDGANDDVALRVLQCAISFGNKTEKWRETVVLEEASAALAASGSAKERVQHNLTISRGNIAFAECFFCGKSDGVPGAVIELKMHGNIQRIPIVGGTRITWTTRSISVPRCAACKSAQTRYSGWMTAVVFASLLAGMAGCGVVTAQPGDNGGMGFLILLMCVGVGCIVGHLVLKDRFRKGVKAAGDAKQFPRALELVKEGWRWGASPQSN